MDLVGLAATQAQEYFSIGDNRMLLISRLDLKFDMLF